MKLRQLQCLVEVVGRDLNMSAAGVALQATQPAISKQVRSLERELGLSLFNARGNRLLSLTAAGSAIAAAARTVLLHADRLQELAGDLSAKRGATLTVASSHLHAKYVLVGPVKSFIGRHPEIDLRLQQASTDQIFGLVLEGSADLGIATEPRNFPAGLASTPCYQMKHSLVMPISHPLEKRRTLTLAMIAAFPVIAHDATHQIGAEINQRFAEAGLRPHFILRAQDSDVMKSYVEAGIGIAIIPKMAFSPLRDRKLRSKDVSHLFRPTTTHVFYRQARELPSYILDFIDLLAPGSPPQGLRHRAEAPSRQAGPGAGG